MKMKMKMKNEALYLLSDYLTICTLHIAIAIAVAIAITTILLYKSLLLHVMYWLSRVHAC